MKQVEKVKFTGKAKKIVELQKEINALQGRIKELKKEQIKIGKS